MKIVFIGAGNLATRLSLAMQRVGMQIGQVYSHTEASARQLATRLGCPWTNDLSALQEDGDLYVFSLKDTVLSDVISKVKPNNGMWVHTAGSMPMSVFEGYAQRFGKPVLYIRECIRILIDFIERLGMNISECLYAFSQLCRQILFDL